MKKFELVKLIVRTTVSMGVGAIVRNAVMATTPLGLGTLTKVLITIGEIGLSSVIGDKTADHAIEMIDEVFPPKIVPPQPGDVVEEIKEEK